MKKTLLMTAIAIVAITGCSKNEITYQKSQEDNAITFRTVIGKQTKAPVADATLLQEDGNGYKSVAYATEADFSANTAALTAYFNETIKYATDVWEADKTLYWPKGKMSLFNYYPCVAKNKTTVTFTDAKYEGSLTYPKLSFTVSDVLADQVDLLAANEMNKAKGDNNAGVQVNFKHILSQLYFKAKASDNSYKVKVKSITVTGATTTATFTYDGTATVGGWSTPTNTQEYKYRESAFPAEQVLIDNTATAIESEGNNGSLMMIPQTAAADFKFKVVYDIYTANGFLLKEDVTKEALMDNFEMGKKYAYVLTLPIPASGEGGGTDDDITPITFTIDISDWGNEVSIEQSFANYALTGTASDYAGAIGSLVEGFNTYRNNLTGTYKHSIKVIEDTDKTITEALTIDLSSVASTNLTADDVVVLDFSGIKTLTSTIKVSITAGNNWTATPAELTSAGTITLKKK